VIVDTGVIYADIDRTDDWHAPAAELLSTAPGPLRVPALVITEVCYLLETRLGPVAEADFLAALSRHDFDPIPLTSGDYTRAAELVRKYADFPLGAVDASVIAVAERLGDLEVATTDRRHSSVAGVVLYSVHLQHDTLTAGKEEQKIHTEPQQRVSAAHLDSFWVPMQPDFG